jgi:hypothetical protein
LITANDIRKAILGWPGLYEARDGKQYLACPVSQIPGRLRDERWRNVGRDFSDSRFLQKMGLQVIEARYIGGVHAKKFCDVVVAKDYTPCRFDHCGSKTEPCLEIYSDIHLHEQCLAGTPVCGRD